jgi:hypothetical protein
MPELNVTGPERSAEPRGSTPGAGTAYRYEPTFDAHRYGPRTDALLARAEAWRHPERLTRVERGYLDRSVGFEPQHFPFSGARGRSYFSATDSDLTAYAARARGTEGWYVVAAHGDLDNGIALPNARGGYDTLTAAQFKRIMDHDPTWDGEMGLLFLSCETGPKFVRAMYDLYEGRIAMCGPPELATVTESGVLGNEKRLRDPVSGKPLIGKDGDFVYEEMPRHVPWLTYAAMPEQAGNR